MTNRSGGVSRNWIAGLLLTLLIALGSALRIISLNTRSFWLDETTAVRQAQWSIPEMLAWMSNNVHPPLFHTLLHYWLIQFGSSEIAVRTFALIWGILAIPLIYWAATTIYERRTGLLAAGIVALAPFFVWYSQEARMYTMLLVFSIVSLAALWRAMEANRVGWWALFALSSAAGIMTQYFFLFLLIGQAIYFLIARVIGRVRSMQAEGTAQTSWRRPWRIFSDVPHLWGALVSVAVIAAPLVWWVPQVMANRELLRGVSGPFNYGWPPPTFGPHFNEQILVPVEWLFGFHSTPVMRNLVASWPLLVTAAFILGGMARRVSTRTWYLISAGVGGAAIISLLGFWQPILEARYFTAVGVPLVVLGARFLAELKPKALVAVSLVALAIFGTSWVDQSYNPDSIVKWDNRAAMGIVADGYSSGDAVLLLPYFASSVTQYYLPPDIYAKVQRVPSFNRFGNVRNSPAELSEDLTRQVGGARRVWVIATWQETPRIALDRRNVGAWLTSNGYRMVSDHPLRQIRVTLYEAPPVPPEPFFSDGAGR